MRFDSWSTSISGCLSLIDSHVPVPLSTFILHQWKALPLAKPKKRREVQASVTRILQEKLYKNEEFPNLMKKRRARVSENNNTDYIGKQFNWRSTGTQVFTREVDVLAPS